MTRTRSVKPRPSARRGHRLLDRASGPAYDPRMDTGPLLPLLQAAVVTRDTIVTLTMPAERTAFDLASGTLQIIVLLVGLVALVAMAASAIALRTAILKLQETVDRLAADAKPLLAQATRVSEEARDVIKLVRAEAEKVVVVTGEVSERLLDVADAAEERVDRVRALFDVMQTELESTALSAAASMRGWRVGAAALGDALAGRRAQRRRTAPLPWADAARDDVEDEDDVEDDDLADEDVDVADLAHEDEDDLPRPRLRRRDVDELDPRERPYFS